MSASRVAALIGAAMCGAWLASAAGVTRQARAPRVQPRGPEVVRLDALAADVQAQAGRLRAHLADAPAPRPGDRNPFSFSAPAAGRRPARQLRSVPAAVVPDPPVEIREPVLQLIGVAETTKPEGIVRTAMITGGHDELMMVMAGQRILGRYDVVVVGADAVELKDVQTGGTRRLILR